MKKSEALQSVLTDPARTPAEREIARAALDRGTCQQLSVDSQAMLRALRKNHLREVSEEEFEAHGRNLSLKTREELARQWRMWVAPNPSLLGVVGLSTRRYWEIIRDTAQTDDVRLNAAKEIRG